MLLLLSGQIWDSPNLNHYAHGIGEVPSFDHFPPTDLAYVGTLSHDLFSSRHNPHKLRCVGKSHRVPTGHYVSLSYHVLHGSRGIRERSEPHNRILYPLFQVPVAS